jgi:hypothetical protein
VAQLLQKTVTEAQVRHLIYLEHVPCTLVAEVGHLITVMAQLLVLGALEAVEMDA